MDEQRALGKFAAWLDRIEEAVTPHEVVLIVPKDSFPRLASVHSCRVIHADVDEPMAAIPIPED